MDNEQQIIDQFHDLYYRGTAGESEIYLRTTWMGVPCQKCPLDMWMYQEILVEVRPQLIVETGTHRGGSALFMAHMLDLLGQGEVITIDTEARDDRPPHPRITYVQGSSADAQLIGGLLADRRPEVRVVVLDSDHTQAHVREELSLLAPYVSVGSYLIVEDTNINGPPTLPTFGPGPYEAVTEFLAEHSEFVLDPTREKFLMTFNPRGYLRRVR